MRTEQAQRRLRPFLNRNAERPLGPLKHRGFAPSETFARHLQFTGFCKMVSGILTSGLNLLAFVQGISLIVIEICGKPSS